MQLGSLTECTILKPSPPVPSLFNSSWFLVRFAVSCLCILSVLPVQGSLQQRRMRVGNKGLFVVEESAWRC